MDTERATRARSFLDLHRREGCFIIPNAWDIGTAKMLEAAGFAAVATTSAGVAFSLGKPDHGYAPAASKLERASMLARVAEMATALTVPLSADLEAGYGSAPEQVADTLQQAVAAGAAGGNIEDFTGDAARPLFELELAVDRIRAARAVVDGNGAPFVLVARTDGFLARPDALDECVRRGNAYREAGADCVFVPGVSDRDTIRQLVREIDAPLNVVMGLRGNPLSLAELRDLGVRRVTIGGSLARSVYHLVFRAAKEMLEHGTFGFANDQFLHGELNQIFAGKSRSA